MSDLGLFPTMQDSMFGFGCTNPGHRCDGEPEDMHP